MNADQRQAPTSDPLAPHAATPRELKQLLMAERDGSPFIAYRDGGGALHIFALLTPDAPADASAQPVQDAPLLIGRRDGVDLQLAWDGETSGVHAELRCLGGEWMIVDDGMSTNGTFVNGRRVHGRLRLRDGDRLLIGATVLAFCAAVSTSAAPTTAGNRHPQVEDLSDTQRRILIALCRPQLTESAFHAPASNQTIAAEVCLSVDAVKTQLRAMFSRYGLDSLPQNQKRAGLAELALRIGLVTGRDL